MELVGPRAFITVLWRLWLIALPVTVFDYLYLRSHGEPSRVATYGRELVALVASFLIMSFMLFRWMTFTAVYGDYLLAYNPVYITVAYWQILVFTVAVAASAALAMVALPPNRDTKA